MNENKDEDKEKFRGEAIVCFIDILGFSDDIRTNWKKPESDPEHPLNKILEIRRVAKNFEEILTENPLPPETHITINSISDSFIIRCSIDKLDKHAQAIKISVVISVVHSIWAVCIKNGYTVRGAISVGDVYWDKSSVIGSAFIDVYKLESTVAKNSRIIISSDMNKKLEELFKIETNEWQLKHQQDFQKWLTQLAECLRKDIDGYLIVNPKTIGFFEKPEFFIQQLSAMKDKIENKIVKEKYTPLIHMLKSENSPPLTASDFGHY